MIYLLQLKVSNVITETHRLAVMQQETKTVELSVHLKMQEKLKVEKVKPQGVSKCQPKTKQLKC